MAKLLTLLFLYVSFISPKAKAHCSTESFPSFLSKTRDNSGPELLCRNDTALISFPSYGHALAVKSVSLHEERLDLIDPGRCVHEVFLNLDLSLTPFRYFHTVESYTYVDCSTGLEQGNFAEIPCMSASGQHVYTVKPGTKVPGFCRVIKTVDIPFGYSSYLDDDSFGLALTWSSLRSGNGGFEVKLVQVFAVGVFIFAIASAISTINATLHNHSRKSVCENKDLRNNQTENERLVADYRTVSSSDSGQIILDIDT